MTPDAIFRALTLTAIWAAILGGSAMVLHHAAVTLDALLAVLP